MQRLKLFSNILAIAVCLSVSAIVVANIVIGKAFLSGNDLHAAWLIDGRDFFVEVTPHGAMALHPELLRLNNGYDGFFREKRPGVFRIFCVGGSTTRGWPFHPVVSYPKLLRLYLRDLLPGRKVEVINAGLMGSDSFNDRVLVSEILDYEPDLILLYEGRNELSNLPFHRGRYAFVGRLHVWLLRNVALYGTVRHVIWRTFDHAGKLRKLVGGGRAYDEAALWAAFRRNLSAMVEEARRRGCGIALLTQVRHPREDSPEIAFLNGRLREFAGRNRIFLIDVDKAFAAADDPGDELVIPVSVHPDIKGYALMARTVCEELARDGRVAPAEEWRWERLQPDSRYFRRLGATDEFLGMVYRDRLGKLFGVVGRPGLKERYAGRRP